VYERSRNLEPGGLSTVSRIPIVPHFEPSVPDGEKDRVRGVADQLLTEQPELRVNELFRPLMLDRYEDKPTLHLDDLSSIPLLDRFYDVSFAEDRARFRAFDGDYVVTCGARVQTFERYCEECLDLGRVTWLRPRTRKSNLRVAQACWEDREVRGTLVQALREDELHQVHPHMGNFEVWATALLLVRESRRPLRVIAPPPHLTQKVNDKIWFAQIVQRLFGPGATPRTSQAWNYSTLARLVYELAPRSRQLVVKRPDSAGGAGNLVLESRRYRRLPLGELRMRLKTLLGEFNWNGEDYLLVGSWETEVLSTPSSQIWIPPVEEGPPLVEGLYVQMLEGMEGMFVGSRPHDFPRQLQETMVNQSWLLALLFQYLGYVGRCSFDMILVGDELDSCHLQFVECNGRWGGTSIPMTLMNRLFGDWADHPYSALEIVLPGLERVTFDELLHHLQPDVFDVRTARGRFLLYNPRALTVRPGLNALALGNTWEDAESGVRVELPRRIARLIEKRA
jgi:hypothetical protein